MDSETSEPDGELASPWQPLTFGGVAGLARATASRLFLVGLVVAAAMALATTRAWYIAWVPVIDAVIKGLPDRCEIRNGRLIWPAQAPLRLADNSFLAIGVSPDGSAGTAGSDVAIELSVNGLTLSSLLGSLFVPYPPSRSIVFERVTLAAQWQAWRPHLVVGTFLLVLGMIWALWLAVGLICGPFVRLYVAMLGRAARLGTCVRLAIAACMPGELLMAAGVTLYGLRRISLAELLAITALHALMVAAYTLISPLWLPPHGREPAPVQTESPRGDNPFAASSPRKGDS